MKANSNLTTALTCATPQQSKHEQGYQIIKNNVVIGWGGVSVECLVRALPTKLNKATYHKLNQQFKRFLKEK